MEGWIGGQWGRETEGLMAKPFQNGIASGANFARGRGHPGVLFVRVANAGLTGLRVTKSEEE
jgi:hypothetical protein